jgi:hypothetical protein
VRKLMCLGSRGLLGGFCGSLDEPPEVELPSGVGKPLFNRFGGRAPGSGSRPHDVSGGSVNAEPVGEWPIGITGQVVMVGS